MKPPCAGYDANWLRSRPKPISPRPRNTYPPLNSMPESRTTPTYRGGLPPPNDDPESIEYLADLILSYFNQFVLAVDKHSGTASIYEVQEVLEVTRRFEN